MTFCRVETEKSQSVRLLPPPHMSSSVLTDLTSSSVRQKKKEKHCTISLLDGVSALIDATDCCCCSDYSEIMQSVLSHRPSKESKVAKASL